MPLYDYKCVCGHSIEITHPISTKPEILCFKCAKQMSKGFSSPVINFKGDGFYSTDK
jgi:putative FmdB family regulatory protein